MAPEEKIGQIYTNKSDLWNIGILGYILYFGEEPFFKSMKEYKIDIHIDEDNALQDLLKKLLIVDPEKRISWGEFYEHKFFRKRIFSDIEKIDFENLLEKYPKLEEKYLGVETEVCHDKDLNIYGEVIKGTKILHGRGICINKEYGVLLRGYFFHNLPKGEGEILYVDGSYFEGEFKNWEKNGKGKLVFPNGDVYKGEFVSRNIHGYGEYKYNSGNIYKGEFRNGRKHGKGKYFYKKTGIIFEGEFINDLRNGKGALFFPDGRKLEGNWKNGIKVGEFLSYKNKDINDYIIEIYEDGVKK